MRNRTRATLFFGAFVPPLLLAFVVAPSFPAPKVTISRETTFITEPLAEDGWPDYLAAINRVLSSGVTPENNAAVPFWMALGPEEVDERSREEFFSGLGIEVPEKEGDYLSQLGGLEPGSDGYLTPDEFKLALDHFYEAMRRPWSTSEFPLVAEWLALNQGPLDRIVEGCRRSHWFEPAICTDSPALLLADRPGITLRLRVKDMLLARAMLHFGEARHEGTVEDLLAIRRLGRLSSGACTLDYLVGVSLSKDIDPGWAALIARPDTPLSTLRALAPQLRDLPAFPDPAVIMDTHERHALLDWACDMMKAPGKISPFLQPWVGSLSSVRIFPDHWDSVLRKLTRATDLLVLAMDGPNYATRLEKVTALAEQAKTRRLENQAVKGIPVPMLDPARQARMLENELIAQWWLTGERLVKAAEEASLRSKMVQVVMTLAIHRAEKGSFPEKLEEILDPVPTDTFAGKPLFYERTEGGFVLRSVGLDGESAAGTKSEDRADDIVFRVGGEK